MDPVNVIVSALIVGAAETSKELVKDTYAALKSLIGKLLHRKKDAPDPIATAEANPEARDKVTEAVKKSGVAADQATVDAAVELLKAADAARPGIEGGVVGQINAAGGKVLVVTTNLGTINM